jgi:protein SCO1/2
MSVRAAIFALFALLTAMLPAPLAAEEMAPAGAFALVAADGATVTEKTYHGRWQLLYFGYTFCPDACPTALNEISAALDALGATAERVQPLFITIDPRRDTREVLAHYLKAFHPGIVGLTGAPAATAAAARAYGVIYERQEDENGGAYLFDHSSFFTIIDPNGNVVSKLPGDTPGDTLAQQIGDLMRAAPPRDHGGAG